METLYSIIKYGNPLKTPPWKGVGPIDPQIVLQYVRDRNTIGPKEAKRNCLLTSPTMSHMKRIAYLVAHPCDKPITVFKNRTIAWPIKDGNHRLASAIIRNDKYINVNWI